MMESKAFVAKLYRVTGAKTKSELSERTGVPAAKLGDWEKGRYGLSLKWVEKISLRLNITIDDLLAKQVEDINVPRRRSSA